MGEEVTVTVLFRPVGPKELALIHASGETAITTHQRLPEQPASAPGEGPGRAEEPAP